jgi:hypothetical protein
MPNLKPLALGAIAVFALLLVAAELPSENALPAGPMQSKAQTGCTTCHDAHIIVQQRLGKPGWGKEVDKMIKWGAIVNPSDRDPLVDYFSANFPPDKPAYVAQRSAGGKR